MAIYPVVFDCLPPGEVLRPPLIILIPAGLIATAFTLTWGIVLFTPEINKVVKKRKLTEAGVVLRISILILLTIASLAAVIASGSILRGIYTCDLDSARDDFKVVVHGQVSTLQVESTLVKLEQAVASLRQKYGLSYSSRHKLHLFPDIETMQKETSMAKDILGFVDYENGTAVLYLAAGMVLDPSASRDSDSIIRHEALHLVFAEILGTHGVDRVPGWFHEGVACYEGMNDGRCLVGRLRMKYDLWSGVTQRTPAAVLLSRHQKPEKMDHAAYITSEELVRYIVSSRGDRVIRMILKNVVCGYDFEQSFKAACGIGTKTLYNEWCSRYY